MDQRTKICQKGLMQMGRRDQATISKINEKLARKARDEQVLQSPSMDFEEVMADNSQRAFIKQQQHQ